jgi:tRNA modification GTPase
MSIDTIAAIATAPGEAGIAIIRISGPGSLAIADGIFAGAAPSPSRRAAFSLVHGKIRSAGQVLDEVMLLVMRAPHSYTREDVVEIQCHGGMIPARRILQSVLAVGARLADPGEFTQRAFLNGRIDLVQAEAVLDLIRAKSERAAAAACEQMEGRLSDLFANIYDNLLGINAELEATLDFSEDDLQPEVIPDVIRRLTGVQDQIARILETWEEGHLLREGALVVISGKPNVGKSTLFNCLLGKDRAIVSAIPGTTRDVLEETFILDGIPLRVVDTAGLRPTKCEIEIEGVRRARDQMLQADLHLHVMDVSQSFDAEDNQTLAQLDPKKTILLLNKQDLPIILQLSDYQQFTTMATCLLTGQGIEKLQQSMSMMLGSIAAMPPHAVVSERHRSYLLLARKELEEALAFLHTKREDMIVLASSKIRTAIESIGQIIGMTYHPDLLKAIFSKFCIGK